MQLTERRDALINNIPKKSNQVTERGLGGKAFYLFGILISYCSSDAIMKYI